MRLIRMSVAAMLVVAGAASVRSLDAQRAMPMVLNLHVVDSTGAPVSGAAVSVVSGLSDVLGSGVLDSAGRGSLTFRVVPGDYQVAARKIGYARATHFFHITLGGTVTLDIVMARLSRTLDAVTVTAERDLKMKSYFIDADDIAKTTRPLNDAWDVVTKLRPDMLTSRSQGPSCPGIQEVWVNGQRIVLPPRPSDLAIARRRVGVSPRARYSITALSVLTDIAPEHIEEMRFRDCFDTTEAVVGTTNALFIVLKKGVEYQMGVGSFVLADIFPPGR